MTDNIIGFPGSGGGYEGEGHPKPGEVDPDWVAVLENALEAAKGGLACGGVLVYSVDDGEEATRRYWGNMDFNRAARASMAMDLIKHEMAAGLLASAYLGDFDE